MLNVYSSGPTHASQKILVSTAGNAFIANPAISNPEAVSSCTRNLGVKSEPHGLYAAHRTRHGSHLSTLGTSSGAWCFWLECWIEDCRLQRIPGTSLPMLQNSTIKPTCNRVQALGGNAKTRTVPNPQCPGSTIRLRVPRPKVPDRISEKKGCTAGAERPIPRPPK
jgi:hypothetical protein